MKIPLFLRALAYNLDAQRANPANLIAGLGGMLVNNIIFLAGIWAMFLGGKKHNAELIPYFVALQVVILTSWGTVTSFATGLRWLPVYVVDGTLETMLATPRSPLLLAAISRTSATALGDLFMGLAGLALIARQWGILMALGATLAAAISTVGFVGVFILAGALCFFIPRGNQLAEVLIDVTLTLSLYPTGKLFVGAGRLALLLTPVAVTALLPLEMVEVFAWRKLAWALLATTVFVATAIALFRVGLRNYRAVSLIGARR